MFTEKSRYKKAATYQLKDRRGRTVTVVAIPPAPLQQLMGIHQLKQGQRTDHLAASYLNDAAGFWRICEMNDAMLPESLTEKPEINIPQKNR